MFFIVGVVHSFKNTWLSISTFRSIRAAFPLRRGIMRVICAVRKVVGVVLL
jgi:hypothetical protein